MKKLFYNVVLAYTLILIIFSLAGCGNQKSGQSASVLEKNSQVVTQQIAKNQQLQNEKYTVRVTSPDLNKPLKSPLKITGQAPGAFFNEGEIMLVVKDALGYQLGETSLRAVNEWMTQDMVSFKGELIFKNSSTPNGVLIFSNFSGPTNAGITEEIPVIFDETAYKDMAKISFSNGMEDPIDKKNLVRLRQACLSGKDCVPSLDYPKFLPAKKAIFMSDDDMVIGFAFGREARAYPIKIMNWHEIINDSFQNKPILVTFCPLSMTGRVFERVVDGETVDFGVSGMLLNSNLVMYDRKTKSLWEQFSGEALIGPKRGIKLKQVQTDIVLWKDWVKKYPNTIVLSNQTGFERDYEKYPYSDYRESGEIYFPLENEDKSRFAKEVVYGIVIGDRQKAYPKTELKKTFTNSGSFEDSFAGEKLKVIYDKGVLRVNNIKTNEEILNTVSFYFSWFAFYPKTEIFRAR